LNAGYPVNEEGGLAAPGRRQQQSIGLIVLREEGIEYGKLCITSAEDRFVILDHAQDSGAEGRRGRVQDLLNGLVGRYRSCITWQTAERVEGGLERLKGKIVELIQHLNAIGTTILSIARAAALGNVLAQALLEGQRVTIARVYCTKVLQVLDALRNEGFMPVRVQQAGSRESTRAGYTRHVVTFNLVDAPLIANESIPEIVLMNAHDGSGAYKLMVGVLRIVCSNGLIVADRTLAAIRVAHVGTRTIAEVVSGTHKLVAELPTVLGQIERWRSTVLAEPQQLIYAREALALRYTDRLAPSPRSKLSPRAAPRTRATTCGRCSTGCRST
jgi:hypothetical protein